MESIKDIVEVIPNAELCTADGLDLVPRAKEIFTEWFDMYKNPEKGAMDDDSIAKFVTNATR